MSIKFEPGDALLIVDIQNDFLPGGSLGVAEGDQVIPLLNDNIQAALEANAPIIASRDWHPANHISFIEQGGLWPVHCVQNTEGAAFSKAFRLPPTAIIVSKAFTADVETYSAWNAVSMTGQSLPDIVKELGIKRLIIGGLALDYCVVETALDAANHGIKVLVQLEATRAITPETGKAAIERMKAIGVEFI